MDIHCARRIHESSEVVTKRENSLIPTPATRAFAVLEMPRGKHHDPTRWRLRSPTQKDPSRDDGDIDSSQDCALADLRTKDQLVNICICVPLAEILREICSRKWGVPMPIPIMWRRRLARRLNAQRIFEWLSTKAIPKTGL